ncbi:component of the polarisome, partial [Coemansia sp. RSA 552]
MCCLLGLPFLPVRDHYHPKRNQARQKLATLSRSKFVDLVRDVNDELKRRFPHKAEAAYAYDSMSHGSSYESLNVSPVYGGPPGPHHPQPGYGRQHSSEISPPTSSGGQPP